MKNLIYIIAILISSGCYAQKKLTKGSVKVNGTTYEIRKSQYGPYISVLNPSNKYSHGTRVSTNPLALPMKDSDMHVDVEKANQIVYSVLKNKLNQLKDNKETISISVIFEQDGTLVDIEYIILKQDTIISIEDIDTISKRLKNEIRMRFTGKDYLDYKAFHSHFSIKF